MPSVVTSGTQLLCKATRAFPLLHLLRNSSKKNMLEGFSPLVWQGSTVQQRHSAFTYLYSLYLEAKALPQCSWGQLYGLCSVWESVWVLSLSTLVKEVSDISHWHFPWLSVSSPLGLGTNFQPVSSSSCFASWIQLGTLGKNAVMAGLVEHGHVKQNSGLQASCRDVVLVQFSVGTLCDQTALIAKLLHLKSQKGWC